ncbi:MAG TPA: 2-dehydro-3-deoxygalactonokinase [Lysobacter sp.]
MNQTNTQGRIVGINWGSSNFRAYLIDADGKVVDAMEAPAGIAGLDRDGMVRHMASVAVRWPGVSHIYACGMIGSNIGWIDAGYVECPVAPGGLAQGLREARIGEVEVRIVPGLACRRTRDNASDIMRGEETELFGLLVSRRLPPSGIVALPGTHTKWVRMDGGRVREFSTAMSGEIFDRLTAAGLLASIVDGPAHASPAFFDGVRAGVRRDTGLGTLLFGARAAVIRGDIKRSEGASYLRGLLIGSEVADARALFPELAEASIPLVGTGPVCALYAAALTELGIDSHAVESREAIAQGFAAMHALHTGAVRA